MKRIAIVGAGGNAREMAWLLEDINEQTTCEDDRYSLVGFLVSDPSRGGAYDSPSLGGIAWLEANDVDALAMGIGNPTLRSKVAAELKQLFPYLAWPPLIHPSVRFQRSSVSFGEGAVVCAGTTVTVNAQIGDFSHIGIGCTISHEAVIGNGCALYPGGTISGGTVLGNGVLVGTGARILQYLRVGDGARVGAGAVVTKDVEPYTTVVGVPASTLRRSHHASVPAHADHPSIFLPKLH